MGWWFDTYTTITAISTTTAITAITTKARLSRRQFECMYGALSSHPSGGLQSMHRRMRGALLML